MVGGQIGWRCEWLEVRVGRTLLFRSFTSAGVEVASAVGVSNDGGATSDSIADLFCTFVGAWMIIGAGSAPLAFVADVGKVCAAISDFSVFETHGEMVGRCVCGSQFRAPWRAFDWG